ncbi:hypothetical protein LCGC14_2888530 [marine sediment metagenome]|uniref:Uncharacterized protein n=1 Tax=marine sediment metagenome TaxID=412755 RepID=A0A0F9A5X8_9ZZZZ
MLDVEEIIKKIVVITFITSFLALFIYFAIFPIKISSSIDSTEKTVIGIDPIAFEIAKNWNNLNLGQTVIEIDSCNVATRIDDFTWQVTMKNC